MKTKPKLSAILPAIFKKANLFLSLILNKAFILILF